MTLTHALVLIGSLSLFSFNGAAQTGTAQQSVAATLDALHQAAAAAEGERYFSLFSADAIFIGTDASERWDMGAFKAYAMPYFNQGKGWTYQATERHIQLNEEQTLAWFDELLWNQSYGVCRGAGVLEKTASGWKVVQYHLTIPIPNALAKEFTGRIKQLQQK